MRLVLVCALMLASCVGARVELSPGLWDAAVRARLEAEELKLGPSAAREVEGRELVVATLSPIAVHAGMEALRQGGTAADAAVATALTQVATDAGAVISYAGVAELLYYEAASGKVYVLDAGWRGYRGETDPKSIPAADIGAVTGVSGTAKPSGRQTLVSGFMAGMEAAHRRFGKLAFSELFEPAIWYAREGVTVSPLLGVYFGMRAQTLARTEAGRRFLGGDTAPKAGETFRQPDVAALLESVAAQGAGAMYRGEWAEHFVEAVRAEGGAAALEDLAGYEPVWAEPLSISLGGATLFGPDTRNASGCQILEALNLMDARGALGGKYWSDAAAFREQAVALKFAAVAHYLPQVTVAERSKGFAQTCEARVSDAYAAAMAPMIDTLSGNAPAAEANHHSASVVAVDRWGNVAALVHSGNAVVWGGTGIVVDGVPLPDAGGLYQARLAASADGRIASDMAPVIALKDGKPVFAIATIGSSVVPETVRLAAGLAGGGDVAELAGAPPLLLNIDAFSAGADLLKRPEMIAPTGYAPGFAESAAALGVGVRAVDAQRVSALRGTASVAVIADGKARAAEAPGVLVHAEAR